MEARDGIEPPIRALQALPLAVLGTAPPVASWKSVESAGSLSPKKIVTPTDRIVPAPADCEE